jgi:hypothetical protein
MDYFLELVDEADKDKNGKIDFGEWEVMGEVFHPVDWFVTDR